MKKTDWHTHTLLSDGWERPETMLEKARELGIESLSITDHDGIEAYRSLAAGTYGGLQLIAGVEIDCTFEGRSIEILGYHIDPDNGELNRYLSDIQKGRLKRARTYVQKINEHYNRTVLVEEEVLNEGCRCVLQPHIIRPLLEKGVFQEYGDAKKFLKTLPGTELVKATSEEAIRLIHGSGGVSVLAHPGIYPLSADDVFAMIRTLKGRGLRGVELYYPYHYHMPHLFKEQQVEDEFIGAIENLGRELDLIFTRGSDSHKLEDLVKLNSN